MLPHGRADGQRVGVDGWMTVRAMPDRVRICHDRSMTLVIAHRGASRAEQENTVGRVPACRRAGRRRRRARRASHRRRSCSSCTTTPHLPDGAVIRRHAGRRAARRTSRRSAPRSTPARACGSTSRSRTIPTSPTSIPTEWVADRPSLELARPRRPTHRWLISSFRFETIDRCRALAADWPPTAWLADRRRRPTIVATTASRAATWRCTRGSSMLDADIVRRRATRPGWRSTPGRATTRSGSRELIAWGIDGICTNVPDVALGGAPIGRLSLSSGGPGTPAGPRRARGGTRAASSRRGSRRRAGTGTASSCSTTRWSRSVPSSRCVARLHAAAAQRAAERAEDRARRASSGT